MTVDTLVEGWLPLVGGISGLLLIIYMAVMIYYARKKDHDIQELRREVAEVKGLLLGRRKPL
jgi:hypothetical protein